ncbi:hypothetical protein GCM10027046_35420 [Uliginosibacterium flavum]|uniref:Glycosyltransferase RgtA/B/C/D-like domain-containing protein n=1 Tax=Uliginosibacterium flavum TaxID=1396831 RepID=A0ABV2TNH5_9RHOO
MFEQAVTPANVDGGRKNPGWAFSRRCGIALALLSLLAVASYVFWLAPYQEFLFSDMKHCWTQAMKRLDGKVFDDSQFVAWPPLYHIFLAELFRVFRWLGLESLVRLETALALNILAFSASVYALQRVAVRWFERSWALLLTVLLYGFGFPALYFNAFLLAENLGSPLLVMAVACIVCRPGWRGIVGAALLFAAATIVRPAMGPFGLAFVAFLLSREHLGRRFLLRAAVFSGVFFVLISLASLEVSRISQGRVNALSANGGLDFFIANTDYHRVDLNYDGWHFFVIVPAQSWKPESGVFYTSTPFYEQGYYFDLGWRALQENPMRAVRNLGEIGNLFFADMLPSRYDAPGFKLLRPLWDWLKLLMSLPLGLYALAWRDLGERKPLATLGLSMLGITMLVSVIFTGEPRYAYAIIFVFYLLSIKLAELILPQWHLWWRRLLFYCAILATLAGATAGVIATMRPTYPDSIAVNLIPLNDESQPSQTNTGRVLFPFNRAGTTLAHADDANLRIKSPSHIHLFTRMEVTGKEPLGLILRAYSSWSFSLKVSGQEMIVDETPNYFNGTEAQLELPPGFYDVEIDAYFWPGEGGLAVNYVYEGGQALPVRRALGVDSERLRFHLPATVSPAP